MTWERYTTKLAKWFTRCIVLTWKTLVIGDCMARHDGKENLIVKGVLLKWDKETHQVYIVKHDKEDWLVVRCCRLVVRCCTHYTWWCQGWDH